jgi:UDP-N-acetylmuramoyl-tripeptide--D-alanyl-D-alanine ligase
MAQLNNYRYYEYFNWLKKKENIKIFIKRSIYLLLYFIINLILIIILKKGLIKNFIVKEESVKFTIFARNFEINFLFLSICVSIFILNLIIFLLSYEKRKKQKKPLVYTKRAIRLKILYSLLYLFFLVLTLVIFSNKIKNYLVYAPINTDSINTNIINTNVININSINTDSIVAGSINQNFLSIKYIIKVTIFLFSFSFLIYFIYSLNFFIMLISQFLALPLEEKINSKYYNLAKNKIDKLKNENLLIIGITGSYGKTSTKFYIKQVLEKQYKVLASKLSFNTPMGLSKTINDELDGSYNIFISEMGARYKNDITELVNLAKPDIGILTAIGPVHLETFKSIENIVEEKWKIIKNSKVGFINIDNDYIFEKLRLEEKSDKIKIIEDFEIDKINLNNLLKADTTHIFTIGSKKERKPYFLIDSIFFNNEKNSFEIIISDKKRYSFETNLLGKHSVENLAISIGLGFLFVIEYNEIFNAVSQILPVEHRLSVLKPNEILTILDDAFNSNPDSARAAIEVLRAFTDRKKIIITPGFIELGKFQYQKNYEFGRLISESVDYAIFVGKTNKDALIEGFKSFNNNDKYNFADNLDIASSYLPSLR